MPNIQCDQVNVALSAVPQKSELREHLGHILLFLKQEFFFVLTQNAQICLLTFAKLSVFVTFFDRAGAFTAFQKASWKDILNAIIDVFDFLFLGWLSRYRLDFLHEKLLSGHQIVPNLLRIFQIGNREFVKILDSKLLRARCIDIQGF